LLTPQTANLLILRICGNQQKMKTLVMKVLLHENMMYKKKDHPESNQIQNGVVWLPATQ
jgi:hypothetical protein